MVAFLSRLVFMYMYNMYKKNEPVANYNFFYFELNKLILSN